MWPQMGLDVQGEAKRWGKLRRRAPRGKGLRGWSSRGRKARHGSLLTARRLSGPMPGPLLLPAFAVWLRQAVVRSAQCPHNSQVARALACALHGACKAWEARGLKSSPGSPPRLGLLHPPRVELSAAGSRPIKALTELRVWWGGVVNKTCLNQVHKGYGFFLLWDKSRNNQAE